MKISKRVAAVVLAVCLIGMAVLGWLTWQELRDRQAGTSYYAALSRQMEEDVPAVTAVVRSVETDGPHKPEAAATAQPAMEEPSPAETPAVEVRFSAVDFPALWQTCPDVKGWISIEGTCIDYPVVQGKDNLYYLSHLPDGTANKAGSIMMDASNAPDFTDDVTILHGHHMRSGTMLGDLDEFRHAKYWEQHSAMTLYTPAGDWKVGIVAACTVDGATFAYPTRFADDAAFAAFVEELCRRSSFHTSLVVEPGDRLVMLSTCAYNFQDARFVVLGKIMDE